MSVSMANRITRTPKKMKASEKKKYANIRLKIKGAVFAHKTESRMCGAEELFE